MKPAMYIFLNKSLGMSVGKAGAQTGHAAVEAYRLSIEDGGRLAPTGEILVDEWYKGGHYMKLIMEARDEAHLHTIERYLNDRGFRTALIIDEGRTEIEPLTATALGVEIVDKDDPHTAATFSTFRLFKDEKPAWADEEKFEPDFNRTRVPETDEFKRQYGSGQTTPDEPWWMKRYKNDPAKITSDLETAKTVIESLRPPKRPSS